MDNATSVEIMKIIKGNIENIDIDKNIMLEEYITDLGITSIGFIKIVVEIETKFGFTFADEELNVGNFLKVKDIISYVDKMLNNKESKN